MQKLNAKLTHLVSAKLGLILLLGAIISACSTSWREEVLLHDGSKVIVTRTVERGGRHEIGQESPIKAQSLNFVLPSIDQRITWYDSYSEDVDGANFLPMQLEISKDAAYVVAYPMGCQSYNKWGRPNPPYVVFKYQDKDWKRIPLQELPVEFNTPNLIFSEPDKVAKRIPQSPVSAEMIKSIYAGYRQPQYRSILRDALSNGNGCSVPNTMKGGVVAPVAPVLNGQILYYNWWPLATDWLKNNYGGNK